jgi:putative endonuclease
MFVYIIHSPARDKFYIGETNDVDARLDQHRTGYFRSSSTAGTKDWTLVLVIPCGNRSKARRVEAFLKRQRNRDFLARFIHNDLYRKTLLEERFGILD